MRHIPDARDYRIAIEDIAAEVSKIRERQMAREGPTGYEDMSNTDLLDTLLIETPMQRQYVKREILARMTTE
jgi:hypothetical protein